MRIILRAAPRVREGSPTELANDGMNAGKRRRRQPRNLRGRTRCGGRL